MIGMVGKVFDEEFSGKGVGYEEMIALQAKLGLGEVPQSWAVSVNLGNSMHVDANDGARSFAMWVARHGYEGASCSWWLLFPRHGVAVAITHGTFISWDGRVAPHATASPCVADGDALVSLFTTVPLDLISMRERHCHCHTALSDRQTQGHELGPNRAHAFFASLSRGMLVGLRTTLKMPSSIGINRSESKSKRRRWG